MSLLAPASLALLGLLPVILLLYFLKLKRKEEPVSSTYLWKWAVEDMRVNSPFQRLRRNLLLYLQLALLALLVMALTRPAARVRAGGGRRHICLIDTSASMAATDERPSRLEAAKRQALELVANMGRGDQMMVMTFDAKPAVLVPFTDVKARLRQAIGGLETRQTSTDFAQAVDLVTALGREVGNARLYLLSDGGFETESIVNTPQVELDFVKVGLASQNVGITAVDARRSIEDWDQPQIFVRVENFGLTTAEVRLDLYREDKLFAARALTIPPGQSAPVTFSDPDLVEGLVKVVLSPEDDLATDNTAWLHLLQPRKVRTLTVSPGNYFLELALKHDELCQPVSMTPAEFDAGVASGELQLQDYELVIIDRHWPPTLPPGAYLFLGSLPPLEGFSSTGEVEQPVVVDWDSVHPVNQYVNFSHLFLERALQVTGPLGTRTLVEADSGPLVLWWSSPSHRIVVVGFDLFASRWPLRVSFPVFLANVVRYFGGVELTGGAAQVQPGTAISFAATPGSDTVEVDSPDGSTRTVPVRSGRVTFADTYTCGAYTFHLGEDRERTYVVNLLDRRESDLTPRKSLQWQKVEVAAAVRVGKENRELWPWLALVGLVLLMVEWYVYNRRVYV